MAILSKIRQKTVFLIVIIAMALFAFVLADVLKGGGGSSNKAQSRVATVNDTELSQTEFMAQVETVQRQMGPTATTASAVNVVWDQEVKRVLLEEEFAKLGIRIEKDQLDAALADGLAGNEMFKNDIGQFDRTRMNEYIADVKANNAVGYQQWVTYEKGIIQGVLQRNYMNMIKGGLKSTLSEGEQQYRYENDKINFQYVQVPYTSINDVDVTVSEDEIKKYINEHTADFDVDAQTDIEYVTFDEKASDADITAAEDGMRAYLTAGIDNNGGARVAFKDAENAEVYVNDNSDVTYQDRWYFVKDIPAPLAAADSDLQVGAVVGPYKNGATYNVTRVTEKRQLADSINTSHILVRWAGTLRASSDITRTKEEAKTIADSILSVVKRTPSKFAAVAAAKSDDASNKDKGGELGYLNPNTGLAPNYKSFMLDNKKGTIGLVETDFGYHIINVTDVKNAQAAYKLATITKQVEASDETINEVFSISSKFEDAARKGDFTAVAKEENLQVRPVNKIGNLDANIPGLTNSRQVIKWSFSEETEVGDVKRFNTPNGYVVARLTRKSANGVMTVADASAQVTPILRNEKKAAMIMDKMSGDDLQAIATANSVTVQTATAVSMAIPTIPGAGAEPKVVGAAFGTEAMASTGLVAGKSGVFKVKVLAKVPAPTLENYASFANQLDLQNTGVEAKVIDALKKKAVIEDNRASFY
ncbi:MAG: peptidyl-prolyl cis-trans isomerase D [Planctomycetota bacterium]|jgi:peptidyl-prolyl cis-trans isomerase D|uniref:peptidylprolyl isomerase n=1 Tax=Patiriisocius sp. Uisw_047 TaxID=3230969 RepID=UPI0039EA67ED